MIKFFTPLLFLSILLFSCNNEPKNTPNNEVSYDLNIKSAEGTLGKINIYSFWGNQQILIHQDTLQESTFTFDLSNHTSPAMFRIQVEDQLFDLIFNDESIHVTLSDKPGFDGIEITESKENKAFYKFLADYYYISENKEEDICKQVRMLREKRNKSNTSTFSHQVTAFLLNSTYNCEKLEDSLFIDRLNLNENLLRTPYISGQMETVVRSLSGDEKKNKDLFDELLSEDQNNNLNHFIRSLFWDIGVAQKNSDFITPLFNDSIEKHHLIDSLLELNSGAFEIGDQIELSDLKIDPHNTEGQKIIFISKKSNEVVRNLFEQLKKKEDEIDNTAIYKIDSESISKEVQLKYTLLDEPIVLLIGKKNHLIDRFYGINDIKHLLVKKL